MKIDTMENEFRELMSIAENIIDLEQDTGLTTSQFLQLCTDIRNSEREVVNLIGKNIIIPESSLLQ